MENGVVWDFRVVTGHLRSLEKAPFDRVCTISYQRFSQACFRGKLPLGNRQLPQKFSAGRNFLNGLSNF